LRGTITENGCDYRVGAVADVVLSAKFEIVSASIGEDRGVDNCEGLHQSVDRIIKEADIGRSSAHLQIVEDNWITASLEV
jgi:hypothetical protein